MLAGMGDHLEPGLGHDQAAVSGDEPATSQPPAGQSAAEDRLRDDTSLAGDEATADESSVWRLIAPAVVGTAGMILVCSNVRAWREGAAIGLPLGIVITLAAFLAGAVVVAVFRQVILGFLRRRPLLAILVGAVILLGLFTPMVFLRQNLATVPAWSGVLLGVVLLGLSTVLYWRVSAVVPRELLVEDENDPTQVADATATFRRNQLILAVVFWAVTVALSLAFWLSP